MSSAHQGVFINPDSYQIIAAGIDDDYGGQLNTDSVPRLFPSGQGYEVGDNDNLVNFSARKLGDAAP
jgi:hypothetical protein